MRGLRIFLASFVAIVAVSAAGFAAFIYSGAYDIAATEQHTPPVYWLIELTMRRSVAARSGLERPVPDVSSPAVLQRGLGIYHAQCERCHGGPGVAPQAFALGMTPAPANLADTAHRWTTPEIYWVVKFGIKMTGMPAWMYRMSDDEMQAVAAFVSAQLRELSPDDYQRRAKESEMHVERLSPPAQSRRPGADEGKRAIQQYACATCHQIPGITGATKPIGPPLKGVATRTVIAGRLRNTRENMVAWLMSPPGVKQGTAMPDLGVTEEDAHSIAAYLETLQ